MKNTQQSVIITHEQKKQLEQIAKKEDRSVASVIRKIITDDLNRRPGANQGQA